MKVNGQRNYQAGRREIKGRLNRGKVTIPQRSADLSLDSGDLGGKKGGVGDFGTEN